MFSAWSAASLGLPGTAPPDSARSRSPSRNSVGSSLPSMATSLPVSEPVWSTGNVAADQWLEEQHCDAQVLSRFAGMPKHKRKSIIIRCMDKKPDNLDAWIGACARNWEEQSLEARVTGIANVHRAPPPHSGSVAQGSHAPAGMAGSSAMAPQTSRPASSPAMDTTALVTELNGAIPKVSTDLFSAWPKDKSALIRVASEVLSGGSLAAFLTLPVPDQAAMAFTIMVAAPENPTVRAALFDAWLQRLEALRGSRPAPTLASPSAPPAKVPTCKVQYILAGLPTCMCAVVVASVQLILPKLHPQVQWKFCPVLFLNEESSDDFPVTETFSQVGLSVREDITSLQKLVGKMASLWSEWAAGEVKFVLVSCLSHDAGLGGSNPLQSSHLHTRANRWLWGMVSASEALRSRAGDNNVADVLICPQSCSADFSQEVTSLWGPAAAGLERFDDALLAGSPRPAFYCTPAGLRVMPVCESEAKVSQPIDNWTGPPEQVLSGLQTTLPGFLPSHLVKLATESLFRERDLTHQESSIFKSLRMRHVSGEDRLCSRQFWCRWYGYHSTPVQKVLLDHEACAGMIIPTTGTVAPPGLPPSSTSACGQDRYCLGCEKHLANLSKGFQTYVVTDMMLALLTKASRTWTGEDNGTTECWTRSSAVPREHMCGDDCPCLRR